MGKLTSILKQYLFAASLCTCSNILAQSPSNHRSIDFLIGLKSRITPIYLERVPDFIDAPNINIMEQPDKHFSGPGLCFTERISLKNNWFVDFSQSIRHDFIFQTLPIEVPIPQNFQSTIRRKVILDFYTDLEKRIPSKRNSYFSVLMGIAFCGINSDFTQTFRQYTSQTEYLEFNSKKDFLFPAISVSLGWTIKNLYTELKFGYCWENPTLYEKSFIFPEFKIQYNLSQVFKKN